MVREGAALACARSPGPCDTPAVWPFNATPVGGGKGRPEESPPKIKPALHLNARATVKRWVEARGLWCNRDRRRLEVIRDRGARKQRYEFSKRTQWFLKAKK
ncbi:hypothetical protein NDU88_004485 [Pleurodeles waltl]|uniref:Uncharacterized protein n=1 Tax=Pleurodeles waltl TaxID=8319 RepID=A0AAV7WW18_PLEWA|nr:hypothetical protein NDU88_004485 [Pleurodeles waltl]